MRLDRHKLVFMGLLALDDLREQAFDAPTARSIWLRFLLAFLFEASGSDPAKKWLFDSFWREALGQSDGRTHGLSEVIRKRALETAMNGICRECGWERTGDLELEMQAFRAKLKR